MSDNASGRIDRGAGTVTAQEPLVANPKADRLASRTLGALTLLTVILLALVVLLGPLAFLKVVAVALAVAWATFGLGVLFARWLS